MWVKGGFGFDRDLYYLLFVILLVVAYRKYLGGGSFLNGMVGFFSIFLSCF